MALSIPLVWADGHRLHEPSAEIWVGVRTPAAETPARADAILRCVQELITNTMRHAQAQALAIEIRQSVDGALSIAARDDGRGGEVTEGHGLAGMRERFEALGGSLSVACGPGRGFSVQGQIPALGAVA